MTDSLLPKKEVVKNLIDLRPISLSDVINKVISRVLLSKINVILPSISSNQSGFIRGRSISENALLAQEIIRDISLRNKNLQYGGQAWHGQSLWQGLMDFSHQSVKKVWLLRNSYWHGNWYSVLVNGQSFGYFRSTRGVKQGDPMPLVLFIIAAEVMSRGLDNLFNDRD